LIRLLDHSQFLQEFQEAIFLVVTMEPLPCKAKDWSRQTRVTTKKGSKFRSDRWIVRKVFQLFLEAVFLVEEMESLLNEEQVSSSETSVMAQKHLNF